MDECCRDTRPLGDQADREIGEADLANGEACFVNEPVEGIRLGFHDAD